MNTTELIEAARKHTGLSDFGDPKALEGLDILVKASNEEARLSPAGVMRWRETLTTVLVNRLRIVDYLRQRRIGSAPSRLIVSVVPVRGRPKTNIGFSTGRCSSSGLRLR